MMTEGVEVLALVSGALSVGYLIGAVFFLKFWRRTGDGLFGAFAMAFFLMGVAAPLPLIVGTQTDDHPAVYIVRLVAFLVIILAILRKNMSDTL